MFQRFRQRRTFSAPVQRVYAGLMEESRNATLYQTGGVPDTPTGRYEMLMAHIALYFCRLRSTDASENEAVTSEEAERFLRELYHYLYDDMETALREMGTGDTGVARRLKRMAESFLGRVNAYQGAFSDEGEPLSDVISHNVFGANAPSDDERVRVLEQQFRAFYQTLSQYSRSDLLNAPCWRS